MFPQRPFIGSKVIIIRIIYHLHVLRVHPSTNELLDSLTFRFAIVCNIISHHLNPQTGSGNTPYVYSVNNERSTKEGIYNIKNN